MDLGDVSWGSVADWLTVVVAVPAVWLIVADRWAVAHNRLNIGAEQFHTAIRVTIGYRPRNLEQGLTAKIVVQTPPGAQIAREQDCWGEFDEATLTQAQSRPQDATNTVECRLRKLQDGTWGEVFLVASVPEGSGIKLMVAVMTWPTAKRLTRTAKTISAIA